MCKKCWWFHRADRTGVLHAAFGKCSFHKDHLYANLGALTAAVLAARPKGLKGGGMPLHFCAILDPSWGLLLKDGETNHMAICQRPGSVLCIMHMEGVSLCWPVAVVPLATFIATEHV